MQEDVPEEGKLEVMQPRISMVTQVKRAATEGDSDPKGFTTPLENKKCIGGLDKQEEASDIGQGVLIAEVRTSTPPKRSPYRSL